MKEEGTVFLPPSLLRPGVSGDKKQAGEGKRRGNVFPSPDMRQHLLEVVLLVQKPGNP